jgi:hypothetical protein
MQQLLDVTTPPEAGDIGRRLTVYWADESKWYDGILSAIEAGRDDGTDAGDYRVQYDDGDDQWEPLGSRTPFRWTSKRGAPSCTSSAVNGLDLCYLKDGFFCIKCPQCRLVSCSAEHAIISQAC